VVAYAQHWENGVGGEGVRDRAREAVIREGARDGHKGGKNGGVIYERKQQDAGKVQLYGKGFALDVKTGKTLPPEVADIEATNKARKDIGLEPLVEYRIAPKAR